MLLFCFLVFFCPQREVSLSATRFYSIPVPTQYTVTLPVLRVFHCLIRLER